MRNCPAQSCFIAAVMCFLIPVSLWATGFQKMPQYPIGPSGATTTGDFNGDGKLDLITVSQCSPTPCSNSTIAVTLGNGKGGFRSPIVSTTEAFPVAGVVVGDFNGDHKVDIAFLSQPPGQPILAIAVALGNGDGTFGATTTYPAAVSAYNLISGDVNGDNKLDLVQSGNNMQVFLGNGDGTFRASAVAPGAFACVLADVNHDGKLDLIGGFIQLGNGDGTFQTAQPTAGAGGCPAVADFNGDGNLDLAVPSQNGQSSSYPQNGVNLIFGNGDGTFQPFVFRGIGRAWPLGFTLSVGDFNGDGKPDLFTGADEIDILLNAGNGKFRPAVGYMSVGGCSGGDLNGDRKTDLICLRRVSPDKEVAIPVLAGPGGTFSLPRSYFLPGGTGASSIMAGDLNNDGNLDIVEVNWQSQSWRGGHLNRLLGNGDGTFRSLPDILTGGRDSFIGVLADLNGDGKLDVLVASGDSINVRLGVGDGNFGNPLNYPVFGAWWVVAVADFNGDGIPDVAVTSGGFERGILFGNGDGTFGTGASLPASIDSLVAGDFNGDGKQDLAVAISGAVGIMLGNGDGTFQPISVLRTGYTQYLLAADFNSDGRLDLAAVGRTPLGNTVVSVYLGNGDGTLQPSMNARVRNAVDPGGLAAADLNGDGKVDLGVSLSSGEIVLLFGDGTGRFQSPTFYFGGGGRLVAGDFDRNGTQDLAVVTSDRTIAVLLNK